MDEGRDFTGQRFLGGARTGILRVFGGQRLNLLAGQQVNFFRYSTTRLSSVLMKNW